MNIIQKPSELNLSGNLPDFIIASTEAVDFTLKKADVVILQASYMPGKNGKITISVRDFVDCNLHTSLKDVSEPYLQPDLSATFTAEIAGQTVSFKVVKAGVDSLGVTPAIFLQSNWLTWQPQTKKVTYQLPEYLTFYAVEDSVVKVKAYFCKDGITTEEVKEIYQAAAGSAYTIPVQYAGIAGLYGKNPSFYDVWTEKKTGERLSYIQRYVASSFLSEEEDWVLFVNSLGGIDTFRAYGHTELNADHTHNLAELGDSAEEYRVDTTRSFQKSTGYLDALSRKWLLDFFPSKQKWVYAGNYLRRIIVTDDDTQYSTQELPSAYTFTYRYADARPFLNIQRTTDVLPSDLEIEVPELGSFTVPPRLVEFPAQKMSEGVLFPVQNPYSETWSTVTVSALYSWIKQQLLKLGPSFFGITIHDGLDSNNPDIALSANMGRELADMIKNMSAEGVGKPADRLINKLFTFLLMPDGSFSHSDGVFRFNGDIIATGEVVAHAVGKDDGGEAEGGGGSGTCIVDDQFSEVSKNPVQNKVITKAMGNLAELLTEAKGSLVAAINECYSRGVNLSDYYNKQQITDIVATLATVTYVDQKIADLINGAPATLDTLKELADALANNKSATEAINAAIANKAEKVHTHPITDVTGLAGKISSYDSHIADKVGHITASERKDWNDANAKKHVHENQSVLDSLDMTWYRSWAIVEAFAHQHANTSVIDSLKQSDIDSWNAKLDKSVWDKFFYFDEAKKAIRVKLNLIGDKEVAAHGIGNENPAGVITIVDNLESTEADAALSANMGRILKEKIDNYKVDFTGYATEAWVTSQKYLKKHQSLSGYATEAWVQSQNYLKEHQSLSGYATEAWVQSQKYLKEHQSLSGYATEAWVQSQKYLKEHQNLDHVVKNTTTLAMSQYKQGNFVKVLEFEVNPSSFAPSLSFSWYPSEMNRGVFADININLRSGSDPVVLICNKGTEIPPQIYLAGDGTHYSVYVAAMKEGWSTYGCLVHKHAHDIISYTYAISYTDDIPASAVPARISGIAASAKKISQIIANEKYVCFSASRSDGSYYTEFAYNGWLWEVYQESGSVLVPYAPNRLSFGAIDKFWQNIYTRQLSSGANQPLVLGANGGEAVYITTSQHVGIGVSSPSEKLEVNGNLRVYGNIIATGEIIAYSVVTGEITPFLYNPLTYADYTSATTNQAPTVQAVKLIKDELEKTKTELANLEKTIKDELSQLTVTSSVDEIRSMLINIKNKI